MINELTKKLFRPMSDAIDAGNLEEVVKLLDEHPAAIDLDTPMGSWLHIAARAGQVAIAKELIKRGMDVNVRGGTLDSNALHLAANKGQFDVVKYLLETGSEVDRSVSEKDPLFAAILRDHDDIVQLLIDHGVDPHHDYGDGWNAIFFAKIRGAPKCLKLLQSIPKNEEPEGK